MDVSARISFEIDLKDHRFAAGQPRAAVPTLKKLKLTLKSKAPLLAQRAREKWGTLFLASRRFLGGGDAAEQVFLFLLAFGTDGEGVQHAKGQGVFDGFVLTVAQCALAEDFHSYYGLPC